MPLHAVYDDLENNRIGYPLSFISSPLSFPLCPSSLFLVDEVLRVISYLSVSLSLSLIPHVSLSLSPPLLPVLSKLYSTSHMHFSFSSSWKLQHAPMFILQRDTVNEYYCLHSSHRPVKNSVHILQDVAANELQLEAVHQLAEKLKAENHPDIKTIQQRMEVILNIKLSRFLKLQW